MIIEEKKGFFRTADIQLDDAAALAYASKRGYARIAVLSRSALALPGFTVSEKPTVVISLLPSEEEMFAALGYENRHKIRKSEDDSTFTFVAEDTNIEAAYDLYRRFQKARGAHPRPSRFFSQSALFSCYCAGEIISAVFVDRSSPHLRARFIFSKRLQTADKELYRRINIASRRLIWEVCIWGKRNGYQTLDLAGINLSDPQKAGITEFKLSFGGAVVPEYSYVRTSALYHVGEVLMGALRRTQAALRRFV